MTEQMLSFSWRARCDYCGEITRSGEAELTEGVQYGISVSKCENCEERTPQLVLIDGIEVDGGGEA